MAGEIKQLKVKNIPLKCPVCPPKLKFGQICLRAILFLLFGLVLAFFILAASGLRIVRQELLLDIWLASQRGLTPTSKPSLPIELTSPISNEIITSSLVIKER